MAGRFPPPGLPWRSGVPAAENQALGNRNAPISPAFASVSSPPGPPDPRRPGNGRIPPDLRPWQWRGKLSAEQAHSRDAIRHLCDPSRPRADYGPTAQNNIKLLGFPKGRAPLVAFRPFWPVKMDPSGKRPHQAGKPASGTIEEQDFVQQSGVAMVKARPSTRRQNVPPPMGYNRENPRVGALQEKTIRYFQFPLFSRGGVWYTT